ncbi:MAG: hypothetical protein ACLP1Q_18550 [Solirubrobacteraceae bacterium]
MIAALAAFALTAVVASSASAGTYYVCNAKKKGKYDAGCAKEVSKKGVAELEPLATCVVKKKGKYNANCEKEVSKKGVAEKVKTTYTTSGGAASLSTPGFGSGQVKCKASTGSGEYTSDKTATLQITFTGCEFSGLPCESAGPNSEPSHVSGDIKTDKLVTKLLDNPETITFLNAETNEPSTYAPVVGEVGNTVVAEKESGGHLFSSEFNCGGVVFLRTYGEDTGVFEAGSVNVLSTTAKSKFEKGVGANGLLTEALSEAGWVGPAPSIEEAGVTTTTSSVAVEVKS